MAAHPGSSHPRPVELKTPVFSREMGPHILIMDTSAAIPLSMPLPSEYLDPKSGIPENELPRSYLDLLMQLPPSLISEIHIPSSVVQEWVGYSCFRDASGKLSATQTVPEYEIYSSYPAGMRFLRSALEDSSQGHPKIVIDCLPEVESHLRQYLTLPASGEERAAALEALRMGEGKNIGEWECAQLAFSHLGKYRSAATILMDDNEGLGHVAQEMRTYHYTYQRLPRLSALNSRSLLSAMEETDLLWQAGFKEKMTEATISQNMVDQQNEAAKKRDDDRIYYLPKLRSIGENFSDNLERALSGPKGYSLY